MTEKYLVKMVHTPTPMYYKKLFFNSMYMKIYNDFAEWTNPQYEKWNAEYEASGGEPVRYNCPFYSKERRTG